MKPVLIACDGSLMGNRGGWAAVASVGVLASGRCDTISSGRCELLAILGALNAIPDGMKTVLLCDHDPHTRKLTALLDGQDVPRSIPDRDLWLQLRTTIEEGRLDVSIRRPRGEEWTLHKQAHHECRKHAKEAWTARVSHEAEWAR